MRDLIIMWRSTRMIVLTAISAAAYVALLLPFKGLTIIPGLTEVRPGAAVPVVLSFMFGPAAAWGAAFGNLIADALGGMLTPGSIPGFFGNLLYGYLPYSLWRAFKKNNDPLRSGRLGWVLYALVVAGSCLSIGLVIGWGCELLKMAPFGALGPIITFNNFIAAFALGTILLGLLYSRVSGMGLLYYQVMEDELKPGRMPKIGAILCLSGAAIGFFSGLIISAEILDVGYGAAAFASQMKGTMAVVGGMVPGLLIMIVGLILL